MKYHPRITYKFVGYENRQKKAIFSLMTKDRRNCRVRIFMLLKQDNRCNRPRLRRKTSHDRIC